MAKVRVQSFAISIDGFGAGLNQDLENPVGINGPDLFDWFFHTRIWREMHGQEGGENGIDNEIASGMIVGNRLKTATSTSNVKLNRLKNWAMIFRWPERPKILSGRGTMLRAVIRH